MFPSLFERFGDKVGVATIEAGCTLGVAMEAGLAEFGDGEKAIALMEEIREGTRLNHILGQGATTTSKVLGVTCVPAVKGQGIPAYEPCAIKGIGMTYEKLPPHDVVWDVPDETLDAVFAD